MTVIEYSGFKLDKALRMSTSYYNVELEQDSYGSAIICLPDELCHDMALQPNELFELEVEDDIITLKRRQAGYDIKAWSNFLIPHEW